MSIRPTIPVQLLLTGGFHIQCSPRPWPASSITLVERPYFDHGLLRKHLTCFPHHRQLVESYLSPCSLQSYDITVDYASSSTDGLGRKYCTTVGGQRMPRNVRCLMFGRNHAEIDLQGSFYELVRRLGMKHSSAYAPLPSIGDVRAQLQRDPWVSALEVSHPGTIKHLPLRIMNSIPWRPHQRIMQRSFPALLRNLWLKLYRLKPRR